MDEAALRQQKLLLEAQLYLGLDRDADLLRLREENQATVHRIRGAITLLDELIARIRKEEMPDGGTA